MKKDFSYDEMFYRTSLSFLLNLFRCTNSSKVFLKQAEKIEMKSNKDSYYFYPYLFT